jgi:hypothetical protein
VPSLADCTDVPNCYFFCPVVVEDTGPARRLQEVIKPKTFKTDVEDGSVRHLASSSGGPRGKPRGRSLKGDDCGKGKGSDSCAPSGKPSEEASSKPSEEASSEPSSKPSVSEEPSSEPSGTPSQFPSGEPLSVEDSCQACIDQAFPFCPEPVPQAQVCGFLKLLDEGCGTSITCDQIAAAFPIIGTGSSFCDAAKAAGPFVSADRQGAFCMELLQLGSGDCADDCGLYIKGCC